MKKNELAKWISNKKNLPYLILFILGLVIASHKYDFRSAILGFGIIIVFALIIGFIINRLIK